MAAYEFRALDQSGRQQKGVLEADSPRQVRQQLRDKGWTPLAVEASVEHHNRRTGFRRRGTSLSAADLALVTRQLATLIQSGIPVEESLYTVSQQSEKAKIRSMMMAIRAKVQEGYSLADSLSEFPNANPTHYRFTVPAALHARHKDL